MSDRLNLIYLAGVDYTSSGFQNATIRGIRRVREVLGSDNSFGPAKEAVDHFLESPTTKMLVDAHTDDELVKRAVREAEVYHQGAAVFEINPESLELPHPEGDPDAESVEDPSYGPFSPAAYRTAMLLLAWENGDPTRAYYRAVGLQNTTGDAERYLEIQYAIISVFPPINT